MTNQLSSSQRGEIEVVRLIFRWVQIWSGQASPNRNNLGINLNVQFTAPSHSFFPIVWLIQRSWGETTWVIIWQLTRTVRTRIHDDDDDDDVHVNKAKRNKCGVGNSIMQLFIIKVTWQHSTETKKKICLMSLGFNPRPSLSHSFVRSIDLDPLNMSHFKHPFISKFSELPLE